MALMILIALYGYLRPYSWRASNILEVVVLTDFLIMLLIRSDPAIVEPSSVFPSSNVSSFAEFNSCHADQEADHAIVTTLTKILTAFYYAPLLLFFPTILVTFLWITLRKCTPRIRNKWVLLQPVEKDPWEDDLSLNLSLIQEPLVETTVVHLRDSERETEH